MNTTKIRFTRDVIAGGQARSAGEIAEIPTAEAWERIHAGDAVPSIPISTPETAMISPAAETTTLPKPAPKPAAKKAAKKK